MKNNRSLRNKTVVLTDEEKIHLQTSLLHLTDDVSWEDIKNKIIYGDTLEQLDFLPEQFVDLMIIDPPYNLSKNYHGNVFKKQNDNEYVEYLSTWFEKVLRLLKKTGSLYICCDWKSSNAVYQVVSRYMRIQNRITWQREKGRGAKNNWKNGMEDIWFATMSNDYYFDVESVKIKRKVLAPYKQDGWPKDWEEDNDGKFRLTYPSNFWDDISIPYWSMPENTDHPTQKPEKLIAKLILASSKEGDVIFDPFLGSGTTVVTAKKLNRMFSGVEQNLEYCLWGQKRLYTADENVFIQGYQQGVFWERNSRPRM